MKEKEIREREKQRTAVNELLIMYNKNVICGFNSFPYYCVILLLKMTHNGREENEKFP
jgi:hypothetical protein